LNAHKGYIANLVRKTISREINIIGLPAHGAARLPDDEIGSILAANAANYAGFAGFTDS
jgi:hypothetical protein